MNTDGKFTILSGGITQGIQKELGLSDNECKKLGNIIKKATKYSGFFLFLMLQ